ncbi:LysM peptidoglycan-binding domain-containing protein [Bradyrhizobium sp.]|uniref:LysM peptidoglycan-binding domain-containing protein n=1 Tax=Bradyrhizobium sp. TaxID=376 RepID=UPI002386220D|nr:LysM peptidoglycan-binding domain-containing protein [Bradyrhizobium sp.]MDE2376773.1 LysM peptidoglycan-binding domain-containing protein [Bradyrhizobium sp.]
MLTTPKAFIVFSILAVIGAVLVIGPRELRDLVTGGTKTELARVKPEAKPETRPETRAETRVAAAGAPVAPTAEAKVETKPADSKSADSKSADSKSADSKSADSKPAAVQAAPAAPPAASTPAAGTLAATAKQAAALPNVAPLAPAPKQAGPSFDVARVGDDGVAVIAGRAAPGARVELMRDGQALDTVVADGSGQFVMTPPKLPGGSYELSLRAKSPDGAVTQSTAKVPVTLAEAAPPPARPAPRASVAAASDADAVAPKAALADAPTGALAASRASRIVSRGDSLWAISRRTYGDGARYSLIFNANRDKIHNPDLIYPGQTFVLPHN